MRALPVVAAFIRRRGRILLAKRPEGKARGGLWEFPGGKVEEGEGLREALARELEEELGVAPWVGEVLAEVEYQYPEINIRLFCLEAGINGEPYPREGQELGWFAPKEIDHLSLAPADRILWSLLKKRLANQLLEQ